MYLFRGRGVLVNRKVNIPSSLAGCLTREQTTNILSQPHFLPPHPKHIFPLIHKLHFLFSLASKLDGECIYTEQCQHHDQNAVCSEVNIHIKAILISLSLICFSRLTLALSASVARVTPRVWCTGLESGE